MKNRALCLSLFLSAALLFVALDGVALEAEKIAEIRQTSEGFGDFLLRLPFSFQAQVFYALSGTALLGALGSWLWKWSQGATSGWRHFTCRYIVGQVLWIIGGSLMTINTVEFHTESGEFFGWMSVIITGGFMGFSGEIKTGERKSWSPAERAAKKGDDADRRS